MRKIGFSISNNQVKEILPKTYKIEARAIQRQMFFTMMNEYLSDEAKIDLSDKKLFRENILNIFIQKINTFFQLDSLQPFKAQKIKKIYPLDSMLFNQFFKQSRDKKMMYLSKNYQFNPNFKMLLGYSHPASQLIQLIFDSKEMKMMFDLNSIFTQTIFKRIKRERNKKVTLDTPYIHIDQHGVRTSLHPRWRSINSKNLKPRDQDIGDGFEQLKSTSTDQCYLVYPKTNNFMRHIMVKEESTNQQLKMIPYSFTFCNRK